jgi:hypothetical protein
MAHQKKATGTTPQKEKSDRVAVFSPYKAGPNRLKGVQQMARSSTTWQKGMAPLNPHGRPKKGAALTEILAAYGAVPVTKSSQPEQPAKHILAQLVWSAVLTGEVELPDGRLRTLNTQEWIDVVKWLYERVDGPPVRTLKAADIEQALTGEQVEGFKLRIGVVPGENGIIIEYPSSVTDASGQEQDISWDDIDQADGRAIVLEIRPKLSEEPR